MVRTTVIGSYPGPGDTPEERVLRRAAAHDRRGGATEVREAEHAVTRAVLREQVEAGIDVVTDGQLAWHEGPSHIAGCLEGVEIGGWVPFFETNASCRQPTIHGTVRWKEPNLLEAWEFAQDACRAPVKAVLTGPVTLARLALDRHYGKRQSLAMDFAQALAEEVAGLRSAGAGHIQVDEPTLARHPEDLPLVAETLEVLAIRKGSAELTLATYFGDVAGIYRDLVDVPADVIGLDLVQGARTWGEVLKRGSEKPLALGVVDARRPQPEDPAALASRVGGLRDSVDLGRSYLSPSSGLGSLPPEAARRKLAVLVAAAQALNVPHDVL